MPTHLRKRHLDAAGAEYDTPRPDHGGNYEHQQEQDHDDHDDVEAQESDRSSFSGDGKKKKFVMVNLSEIRKEVQCPICLGIIRKTRTVMECLHRFCRECIDKSMRLGNNECPACRTHCASRRSLRDDKNYDKLIAYLYPDIDKYEEEELALNEEDKARNKQIQASIAQTIQRQFKPSSVKRSRSSKRTAAAEMLSKSRLNLRDNTPRGQRDHQTDDISDDGGRDSSSTDDEPDTEVRPKRRSKRPRRVSSSQPYATTSADRSSDENSSDVMKESTETVRGIVCSSERLAWGKGGMRSHTRHGNGSSGNGKNCQNSRIARLVDYLKNLKKMDDEMDIGIRLVSMDEQKIPNLQKPYLSCKPTLSVECLCQYIALHSKTQADEIEICVVKELQSKLDAVDLSKDKLQIVNQKDSLGGLRMYDFNHGYVILAYQKRASN